MEKTIWGKTVLGCLSIVLLIALSAGSSAEESPPPLPLGSLGIQLGGKFPEMHLRRLHPLEHWPPFGLLPYWGVQSALPPLGKGVVQAYTSPVAPDLSADEPSEQPDLPNSLIVFLAPFAQSRVLGLLYVLNPHRWRAVDLVAADAAFTTQYGPAQDRTELTPALRSQGGATAEQVTTRSWTWLSESVRLRIYGEEQYVPFAGPQSLYILYLEYRPLAEQARQLTKAFTEEESRRGRQE